MEPVHVIKRAHVSRELLKAPIIGQTAGYLSGERGE
jgi:hypothetical protein